MNDLPESDYADQYDDQYDVVIIGAGFAGLYALYKLRELGLRCRVYEAGSGVGGVWHWNRYPGARCDSESFFYCYSFSPEVAQEWTWTQRYPGQGEISDYLNYVADKFALRPDIQLDTRVVAAAYREPSRRWQVQTDTGKTVSARYVVTAMGQLSQVNLPAIPGLDRFAGPCYHPGCWPADAVDFTGLRVGVIGTESTGTQLIPVIAERFAELTVFQRTPNFSMPARNGPLDPDSVARIKATYPEVWRRSRVSPAGWPLTSPTQRFDEVSREEARQRYETAWSHGGLEVLEQFSDVMTNRESNDFASEFFREKIKDIVKDPVVAEKLTPRGYPIAAKRQVVDTNYYETFNLPHVHVIDLKTTPITEVTPTGIRVGDAEHELDVLILATGYDAVTGAFDAIDFRGRDGVRLSDKWKDGPTAYLGMTFAGFPNLFAVTGPFNPASLTNVPFSIEHDVEWIAGCIEYLERLGFIAIEATEEAEEAWVDQVGDAVEGTLYPEGDSWWLGANIPGKPRRFAVFIEGHDVFRVRCDRVAETGYDGFTLTAGDA